MAEQPKVSSNIYTILIVVASLSLLVGVVYLAIRSDQLFKTINPIDAKDQLKDVAAMMALPFMG